MTKLGSYSVCKSCKLELTEYMKVGNKKWEAGRKVRDRENLISGMEID